MSHCGFIGLSTATCSGEGNGSNTSCAKRQDGSSNLKATLGQTVTKEANLRTLAENYEANVGRNEPKCLNFNAWAWQAGARTAAGSDTHGTVALHSRKRT